MQYFFVLTSLAEFNDIMEWAANDEITWYKRNTFFYKENGRMIIKFTRNGKNPGVIKIQDPEDQLIFRLHFGHLISDMSDHIMNEDA